MTVELEKPITLHKGDGSVRVFPFFWKAMDAETVKGSINGYEISDVTGALNPNQDEQPGGTLTFNSTIPAAGAEIAIFRRTKSGQSTKFVESGRFPAKASETALDKLTMLVQEMGLSLDATIRVPLYEGGLIDLPPSFLRRRKVLGFDDNGMPYMADPIGGGLTSNNIEHQPSGFPQSTVGAELRRQEAADNELSDAILLNSQGIQSNSDNLGVVGQRLELIESYDLDTRVGQNEQDINSVEQQALTNATNLSDLDAKVIKKSNDTTGGVDVPRWADDAARPDTSGYTKSVLGYNIARKAYEAWNPETGKWGNVGGGLERVSPAAYPHTASAGTYILSDLTGDVSRVIDIPLTLDVDSEIKVSNVNWSGTVGVTTRLAVDATQKWAHPEYNTGDSVAIHGNQIIKVRKLPDGSLAVVEVGGEQAPVGKVYPTEWADATPLLGTGMEVYPDGNLLYQWRDKNTIEIAGILRKVTGNFISNEQVLTLPTISKSSDKFQYRKVGTTADPSAYVNLVGGTQEVRIITATNSSWVIFDCSFYVEAE